MGSPAVVMSSPRKSPSAVRRTNKPLVEKKRRARINGCLGQLKSLILSAMKTEGTQVSRLEKADILEMTVKYLRHIQRQQATSSETSEPEVVAKFSAGYSECAAEVIRYMDSVTGVTPDVRYRLESHLVGRLQGSMPESGVNQGMHQGLPPRPDAKPSQTQSQALDETSIHYQAALELANMASSVKVSDISREDHSTLDTAPQHHTQEPKFSGSVSYVRDNSSGRISPSRQTFIQDQVFVRPKTISPMDISHCASMSSSSSSVPQFSSNGGRQAQPNTEVAMPSFKTEDIQSYYENHSEYLNTAPTPPDTPPYSNDVNNNDLINSSTGSYIYLKGREVYINQAAYDIRSTRPPSPTNRNTDMTSQDQSYACGRDHVIKKHVVYNSFTPRNFDIEMKNEVDQPGSEMEASLQSNSMAYRNTNCQRNYNLSAYQQPLHIQIPDSPTSTTPSPPQLFPSHPVKEQQQKMVYNQSSPCLHQRSNSNAVLPTILYGLRGSDPVAISGSAVNFRSHQTSLSHPTQVSTATDDFNSQPQSTCNLEGTNCSNITTADSRSQSQISFFKQSTWPVATEHAQNRKFQGHSSEQLSQCQSQPQQRSPSSSPLSPPTLTREDLRPPSVRPSNESERALDYFNYDNHRSSSLCRMRRNSHEGDTITNGMASSRRLTFAENGKDGRSNAMPMPNGTGILYCREHDCEAYSRSEKLSEHFRSQEEGIIYKNTNEDGITRSPHLSSRRSYHEDQLSSPKISPLPQSHLRHLHHHSAQDEIAYSQNTQVDKQHQQIIERCKNPRGKDEQFSSPFTSFRRRAETEDDPTNTHPHRSSPFSPPSGPSPFPSPTTIVPSHVLAHSQEDGMRSLYQESQAYATHLVNSTTGHHLGHGHNNNMNGSTMSEARDLSRQNVSPLSPSALKRVMMGHRVEVSARPGCTGARPAESPLHQRIGGGQSGVRGQGFAILRRVPQDTPIELGRPPFPIERVPPPFPIHEHNRTPFERAAIEGDILQATQIAPQDFTEERLWRPW